MKTAVAIAFVTSSLWNGAEAKEQILQCPTQISVGSLNETMSHPGWRLHNRNKLLLHSAAFTGGAPEKMMELVPFQVTKKKGHVLERWRFIEDDVWLRCSYGPRGEITLSKQVEGELAECSVSYDGKRLSKIVCISAVARSS